MASITESPLPKVTSSDIQELGWREDSDHYYAYVCIQRVEAATTDADNLVSVRIAGYMLIEFAQHSCIFGSECSAQLAQWIISPAQGSESEQEKVIRIGEHLRDKLIRMFRTTNTVHSQPVSHPLRRSFDTLEDMMKDAMESTSDEHTTSKRKVLARDGFRCVITGIYDHTSVQKNRELRKLKNIQRLVLGTAHIFTSAMKNIDPAVDDDNPEKVLNKTRTATVTMATLKSFGFSYLTEVFVKSGGVHEVWNLMMLQRDLHTDFDQLYLWFEYTEKPHRYKVRTFYPDGEVFISNNFRGHDRHIDGAPGFVEFNSQCEGAPPPSPLLLALHATCARVFHKSGAGDFFNQIERDVEDTRVLAGDGSSARLLTNLLAPYVDPIVVPSHVVIPGVA